MSDNDNTEVKTDDKSAATTNIDKLLSRGGGGIVILLLAFATSELSSVKGEISTLKESLIRVTTKLEVVSPAELREDILALRDQTLNKDDVQSIVGSSAPWLRDKEKFETRVNALEARIRELEIRVKQE